MVDNNKKDKGKGVFNKSGLEALVLVSQLGYTLSLPIVFGALAGNWIDKKLGTDVVFSLILILVGIVVGIIGAYKQVMYVTRKKK
ncbi:MAG: AtpZ/AtpI family protein [Anaerovoracaceae bacterium]|jgi:ATP synthase protein I